MLADLKAHRHTAPILVIVVCTCAETLFSDRAAYAAVLPKPLDTQVLFQTVDAASAQPSP